MSGDKDEPPRDGDDNDVGYGKPPKRSRFKPGQSGNPKGRPKRARSKAQQFAAAMDQPTREMFMAEMKRPVRINDGVRDVPMPIIQMITRSMVKSAAAGGQQAQRTAIMLQLELEREAAAEQAKLVSTLREYKDVGGPVFARYRALGLPEPDILPHPDDIFIDEAAQRVEIRGPSTPDGKRALDELLATRERYQRGVTALQYEAKTKVRDYTLLWLAAEAQELYDHINDRLPERYRKKLENRMTAQQIAAGREKTRRGVAARERRLLRAQRGKRSHR
jgi:hypothetical protein